MSTDSSQSDQQFEQEELGKLDGWQSEIRRRGAAFADRMATPVPPPIWASPQAEAEMRIRFAIDRQKEIASFMLEVEELQETILRFDPGARYLNDKGRPQLAGRMFELLKEMQQAMQIYSEMHASQQMQPAILNAIWAQAQTESLKIVQDTLARSQNVFDEVLKRWSDVIFNICPHCGFYLNSRIYPHCCYCHHHV